METEAFVAQLREDVYLSLDEIGIGQTDLLLVHWPGGFDSMSKPEMAAHNRERRFRAWSLFEELYELGVTRAIGVSNFTEEHLKQLVEDGAKITPHVNQVEVSPHCQYTGIMDYCREHKIVLEAYSPLGSTAGDVLKDQAMIEMGKKYGKNPGQIALKWLIQQGIVVLPRSSSEARMRSNMDIFDFEISAEDMAAITALNKGKSFTNADPYAFP